MSLHPPPSVYIPSKKYEVEAPPILSAGRTITFTPSADPNPRTLTLTILKPFAPFTKSVVLLVRADELGPDPAVIKIFDPRFLNERLIRTSMRQPPEWTLAAETAAASLDDSVSEIPLLYPPPPDLDAQGVLARDSLWEKQLRRLSYECFDSEWRAYERLRVYQGSAIPRMFMKGSVIYPDARAIHPPAVIIEYIPDPLVLRDVAPGTVDADICITLRAVDTFGRFGLFHGDINPNNVLFSPKARPTRAVLIDFGCAGFRIEGQSDEEWAVQVNGFWDSHWIRLHLREQGIPIPEDI
ncbi:hypothetical protein FKP32DRAFT_1589175 [Trametes sanguinea]|nr:hypothetical protein FKP32DRAFT_1589175 [Trametes sanguinea]